MSRRFSLRATFMILAGTFGRVAAAQDGPLPPAPVAPPAAPAAAAPSAPANSEKGCLPAQPVGAATAPAVVWHANGLDAMVEAVENHKALVVLFRNDPADDSSRFGRTTIEGLQADGLAEFRDRAVFVEVVFHRVVGTRDEWGIRLARHLKITDSPTLSIVAPNEERVTEVSRSEGFFTTAELKDSLRANLSGALDVKRSWLPTKSRDLVTMFEEALAKADRRMHAACFVEPIRSRMIEVADAQTALGNSKRRLLAAIDERFGLQTERLTFVDDDEEAAREMREVTGVEHVVAVMQPEGAELEMLVTRVKPSGAVKKQTEKLLVVVERHGLRFTCRNVQENEKNLVEQVALLNGQAADFDAVTARVAAGAFDTAEAAREHAISIHHQRKSAARL